ncbi:hypothetical protein Bbelb_097480 [Branchiostoma belcheri]|nr:hypothetical protein Bbelb_097480 [Branchiostoma belcheri]
MSPEVQKTLLQVPSPAAREDRPLSSTARFQEHTDTRCWEQPSITVVQQKNQDNNAIRARSLFVTWESPRKLHHKKERQRKYYDRQARDLPNLPVGDTVRCQPITPATKHWQQGTVVVEMGKRLYKNRLYRRRWQIP